MLTILGPSPMALFTAEAEGIGRERLEVRPSHLLSSSVSTLTICTPINAYLCQSFINPCHCIYQSSPCSRALRSQTLRRCSQDELQPSSGRQLQRRSAQISSARCSNNEVKPNIETTGLFKGFCPNYLPPPNLDNVYNFFERQKR